MKVRFVSRNELKVKEVKEILSPAGIEVIGSHHKIDELQTENVDKLVRDKLLKAFLLVGRPVFVEHTGLYLSRLNGLPGGLTQIFWDKLQAAHFSTLFGNASNTDVVAKTVIGYCDGRKIYLFSGEIKGAIASSPRGSQDFQWDCVFVPEGAEETFAEMGERKNTISMRKIAFDGFIEFLKFRSL
ncbi:non-canonical purine NTP pyrophosphatase [Nitrosospira lacus]|uniref:Non-canonical purine NTP pyrophosphatase n=1 Tax=Nitrosospira lacus TaxID=1288494 RepID=A0A1W6SSH0_9PROT|nr:non-canonical purine NTP pyrophosphatase [Nitrosospira lacus]